MTTLNMVRDHLKLQENIAFTNVIDRFVESLALDVLDSSEVGYIEINKTFTMEISNPQFECQFEVKATVYVQIEKELATSDEHGRKLYTDCYDLEEIEVDSIKFFCYNAWFDLTDNQVIREMVIDKINDNYIF